MAEVRIYHTGILLFANFKTRALLPDLRCGGHVGGGEHHGGGNGHHHDSRAMTPLHHRDGDGQPGGCCIGAHEGHPQEPHFAHIRFPLDAVQNRPADLPCLEFEGIDPIDGRLRWFGLVMLHRQAVIVDGKVSKKTIEQRRRQFDSTIPAASSPSGSEQELYYWVSNPTRFTADTEVSIRGEYLEDDPATGIAGYVDSPYLRLEPYFGNTRINVWSFRPRLRGNRDHTQALAQVVVKSADVEEPVLRFRTFGKYGTDNTRVLTFKDAPVDIWVGNTTRPSMMLRPNGFARSPDHHFDFYYEYLCPPQAARPLPHLETRFSGPPEVGGSNCPPMDPPPPPPPP